ncbi:MAG: glycolate oxidase subunit GlcE [Gluconacetobacter diazotrophicus]|nr:glycolate oxidase subunit GlcE [Gluconacetobacter diazotrophicus]
MGDTVRPRDAAEVRDCVAQASADSLRLAVRGGGSKTGLGATEDGARILDMRGIAGIVDYDPAELVLTVRPGTPLAEVTALLEGSGQMLAFEPWDHGELFGQPTGEATIGGVVAAGVSGSGRLSGGAARDHLLGFRAVSGRAQEFVGGGKVVKNVTGYDLPKLMAGSWGRLAVLTELTLKVLPRPRATDTRVLRGLSAERAVAAMALAMGSRAEVAAAAHLPGGTAAADALTLFRVQGFGPSVAARCAMLDELLSGFGRVEPTAPEEADGLWAGLRTLSALGDAPLWRVAVPPRAGAGVAAAVQAAGGLWLMDWAGGLLWATLDGNDEVVREAAERAGGHATLVRAPEAARKAVPAFHPQPAALAALEERVRRAFDPHGVFETGRFR